MLGTKPLGSRRVEGILEKTREGKRVLVKVEGFIWRRIVLVKSREVTV